MIGLVGPVSARFKGKVKLTDIDPPNGYTISGEGNGGAAGFAKGSAKVKLTEAEGGTLLSYTVTAQVGGKLAQIGQRFIDSTAARMSEEFFDNFSRLAGGSKVEPATSDTPELISEMEHGIPTKSPDHDAISPTGVPLVPDEEAGMSFSPWVWGPLLIIALIFLLWFIGF